MKKQSIFLMTALVALLGFTTLAFTNSNSSENLNESTTEAPQAYNDVGEWVQGGNHIVYENKLLKKFKDGGTITNFKIVNLATGWTLVRAGTLNGDKRSEAIPIAKVGGIFKFIEPVWFTTCFAPICGGFCRPNSANNACICTGPGGEGDCTFGNPPYQLYDVEVLSPW